MYLNNTENPRATLFTPFFIVDEDESLHHKISNFKSGHKHLTALNFCEKSFKYVATTTFTMLTSFH